MNIKCILRISFLVAAILIIADAQEPEKNGEKDKVISLNNGDHVFRIAAGRLLLITIEGKNASIMMLEDSGDTDLWDVKDGKKEITCTRHNGKMSTTILDQNGDGIVEKRLVATEDGNVRIENAVVQFTNKE